MRLKLLKLCAEPNCENHFDHDLGLASCRMIAIIAFIQFIIVTLFPSRGTWTACVLQNFATIGIPDFEEETLNKSWSIVALSQNLIDEERLNGLQHLSTRPLDLVIHNGTKFALLNMQAFKIFECQLATETIRQCSTHYLTPDGNLLLGVQPSGDVVILTDGLQRVIQVRKPAFIKIQQKQPKWYEDIPGKLASIFSSKSKISQVSPEATLQNIQINGNTTTTITGGTPSVWWQTTSSSQSCPNLPESLRTEFPYLTSLEDGFAILCAFSPIDCYIFLSSYETALRRKSIANIRGNQVPGRWYRIIMHKSLIAQWLQDKKTTPIFQSTLCYKKDENGDPVVGGAMLYGVMENLRMELVYGIIKRRQDKFTLSWEVLQFDVDWALEQVDGVPYNLGARSVAKLSSDCTKIAIVISNHLGVYVHIQDIPTYQESPVHLKRLKVSLCTHSDYDGTHFYKKECWISDVQWLVEDAYLAVMTHCGSLSIFYSSGEPMIVKVRKPGPDPDETKSARFYFPVFHPHQIRLDEQENNNNAQGGSGGKSCPRYPTIKWIDTEQVLTCSSGIKIELFSIQRVMPIGLDQAQSEIWLGAGVDVQPGGTSPETSRTEKRKHIFSDQEYTASYSSFASSGQPRSNMIERPEIAIVQRVLRSAEYSVDGTSNIDSRGRLSPVMEYKYERENDIDGASNNENGHSDYDLGEDYDVERNEGLVYPLNDVDSPSRIEELPPDGGELEQENLDSVQVDPPSVEKLRHESEGSSSVDVVKIQLPMNISDLFLDTEDALISMPNSLHQMENDEYSNGSSEPDFGGNGHEEPTITITPLEQYPSIPDMELDLSALRKRSQLYMADDEADYNTEDEDRRRGEMKRKPVVTYGKSPMTPESDLNIPRSSSAYDTDYSRETYSSPFSDITTTPEDQEDEDNDHDEDDDPDPITSSQIQQIVMKKASIPTTIHWEAPRAKEARSKTSSISLVSLQMPPVPVISGVIVPSERQSAVLLQNIQLPTTSIQQQHQSELLRYKPPSTNTFTTEPLQSKSKVDIFHKIPDVTTTKEKSPPPHGKEKKSRKYFAEDDGEEDGSDNVNRNDINFSPTTSNDSGSRYRHHHHTPSV